MATNLADTTQTGDERKSVNEVVIRFAGDSGDGMQLTGTQFTQSTALMGNDLATFADRGSKYKNESYYFCGSVKSVNRKSALHADFGKGLCVATLCACADCGQE